MRRRQPSPTRTDTLVPYPTLFRSFHPPVKRGEPDPAPIGYWEASPMVMTPAEALIELATSSQLEPVPSSASLGDLPPLVVSHVNPLSATPKDRKSTRLNSSH